MPNAGSCHSVIASSLLTAIALIASHISTNVWRPIVRRKPGGHSKRWVKCLSAETAEDRLLWNAFDKRRRSCYAHEDAVRLTASTAYYSKSGRTTEP